MVDQLTVHLEDKITGDLLTGQVFQQVVPLLASVSRL